MRPHIHTLNLLREILENIPENFPTSRKSEMEKEYQTMLSDEKISLDNIEETIRKFGGEVWPFRKAFEKMFELYGGRDLQQTVMDQLDPALKNKYQQYLNYHSERQKRIKEAVAEVTEHHKPASQIPDFLSNQEYLNIEQAEIDARKNITAKINQLVSGDKADEFQKYLQEFQNKQKLFSEKITGLRSLAGKYPGLAAEINDSVKTFQEAFSLITTDVDLVEINKKIEDYRGRAGESI
ncbi:MAG TPA: hypothetical protein VGA49_02910 [Patescibacteria group bacterium]